MTIIAPRSRLLTLVPVLPFTGLTIAYVATNSATPHPDASGAAVLAYTTAHQDLIHLGTFLLLLSAAPLVLATGLLHRALRAPAIAVMGGALAASGLTLSALFSWTSARLPSSAAPESARAFADLAFLTGGPAYAAGFGLLALGLSIPVLMDTELPRWVGIFGLVIAVAAALSTLALVASGFTYLLPVVRFGGLIWLICTAVVVSRRASFPTESALPAHV